MKPILTMVLAGAVLTVPAAYGADEHDHADKASPPASASPEARRPAPGPQLDEKSMAQMQAHMKTMQATMAKMQKTTDPAERQKLMDEHMNEMREGMRMMQGMMPGMMPGMMGGDGMSRAPK